MIKPIDRISYLVEDKGFSLVGFLFSGPGFMIMIGGLLYFCYKGVMPKLEEAQMAPENTRRRQE